MKISNIALLAAFMVAIVLISHSLGQQAYDWLPVSATVEAVHVGDLFSFLVTLGAMVFFGVLGTLLYSILVYRAAENDTSDALPIRGNWKLEATWTVIPICLVIWIAGYSYVIYQRMNVLGGLPIVHLHNPLEAPAYAQIRDPAPALDEVKIEVTAKQWSWSFHYPTRDVTSSELHLPVNQRVHLVLTSEDVLHGFYVPNFRLKQDIVPNRAIDIKFTPNRVGQYQLHDSQFSGTYFALMQADVYVDSAAAYDRWLAQATSRSPVPAVNRAVSEHIQPAATPLKGGWPSVVPAKPPTVNPAR